MRGDLKCPVRCLTHYHLIKWPHKVHGEAERVGAGSSRLALEWGPVTLWIVTLAGAEICQDMLGVKVPFCWNSVPNAHASAVCPCRPLLP